ncbi:scavenger receptor cysteine-rich type 1 protein M130-like [Hypomesus transpacificus]|uniref:scavenger receptor cysteine-rich type 1 protein M130-like n=1 Tax=Hypomesus transpacificus TaxID=137520 RepID=UPI001F087B1D|nr:scavenger receptor cysteine-rich type 1 protein M130-like [Hypomesus transpacificus]
MVPVLMLVVMFWSTGLQDELIDEPPGSDVRLEGGDGRCAGGVEMKHQEEWRRVGSWSDWDLRAAVVVCRQLDCGSAVSTRFTVGDDKHDAWEFRSACVGSESALRECGTVEERYSTSSTLEVICSESVRLVDGAGLCSGRVEVRSDQSWVSVCEADFDRLDAEVVCQELGCGAPSALQGALYGEGKGPLWDKEFQCGGTESRLLDCDTSDSARNTCSPGNAVGLTCSGPDDVRFERGDGRCVGRVELKHQGEWKRVGWAISWDLRAAAVLCRQLDCGSAVSTIYTDNKHPTWRFVSHCVGSESALMECITVDGGYETSRTPEVICSGNTHIMLFYSADDVDSLT